MASSEGNCSLGLGSVQLLLTFSGNLSWFTGSGRYSLLPLMTEEKQPQQKYLKIIGNYQIISVFKVYHVSPPPPNYLPDSLVLVIV